jgi:Na+-transporting NADH:ubiquinone oxidoreductase subunit F
MCALTGLLTLLILAAEATIANYGEVTLTVNDRKTYRVSGGRPLLSTLKDQQIFIPSACGGRGSCGLCKVRVAPGLGGAALPTELPWLSADERKNNTRLACQCKVKGDLGIYVPEQLFSVRQFSVRVSGIRDLTHDIKEVRLALLDPSGMDFVAGQFIQIEVPPYALTDETVYRAYSVASPPASRMELELEIRYVPNGICTTYVHRYLKVGDVLTINGPHGEFFLRDTAREVICIAGGSGMAPIKAILEDLRNRSTARRIRYFFGARSKRDLFLVDEMTALEKVLPDFRFIPALSEPLPEDHWTGETGLITDVVNRHTSALDNHEAYLCGSPLMIDACIKVLRAKGLPEDRIFYDKFA